MVLRVYKPGVQLSQYVERMWWNAIPEAAPSRQRIYPDGAMALVIHLNKPATTFFIDGRACSVRVPLLAGPYSRSFQIDPSQSTAVVGVLFRPGAARTFFPVAPHELHNLDIALSDLCADEADRLLNETCSARDTSALLMAMEQYLKRRLKDAAPIHPVVRYAVGQLSRAGGVRRVRQLQLDTGLSHTRFIQLFREHVGMTPKLFCRVRRFCSVLERIESVPVQWAELAADCGYFDQAHMIHDFRVFAGITPAQYGRTMTDADKRVLAAVRTGTDAS